MLRGMSCVLLLFLHFAPLLVLNVHAGTGHATFYGGQDASGTNNGACGFTNVFSLGYGTMTAALSVALFDDGRRCGACYQIACFGSSGCLGKSITVTATNECPNGSFGGWCDYPNQHFDLSAPAFAEIANQAVGHVPITYQKVSCERSGGIRFYVQGHTYYLLVLVYNVAGAGDLSGVTIRGSRSSWFPMQRTWGVNWSTEQVLDGQALSFKVTTSDGNSAYSFSAANQYWSYFQTFEGNNNF